jgi:high-affinity nickel permease
MLQTSTLFVLGIGFILGLKHAMDPDHIVAVTTFIGKEKQIARACAIGFFWGLGHTLALSVLGLVVVGLKVPMSQWLAARLELVVAAMLVALGARLITAVHHKWHEDHRHDNWTRRGWRPLLVGLVHGAAGSAALTLLVLSTIPSTSQALLYILIFGIGSTAGMLAISVLLSLPLHWAQSHLNAAIRPIQMGAGVFSCLFGVYLGVSVWRGL